MGIYDHVQGFLYLPSYARSPFEVLKKFDEEVIDRELGWAEDIGFNTIRPFISYNAYGLLGKEIALERVEKLFSLSEKHGFKIHPMLFASPTFTIDLGDRSRDSEYISTWIKVFGLTDEKSEIYRDFYDRFSQLWWPQEPGYTYMDKKHWGKIDDFLSAILSSYKNDSRLLHWDLMIEPFVFESWRPRIDEFIKHICSYAKDLGAKISVEGDQFSQTPELDQLGNLDVLEFGFWRDFENIDKILAEAKAYERKSGKPVMIGEWGNHFCIRAWGRETLTDEEQLQFYEKVLSALSRAKIGWNVWCLMVGYDTLSDSGLIYPSGQKRPAASFLRKFLTESR